MKTILFVGTAADTWGHCLDYLYTFCLKGASQRALAAPTEATNVDKVTEGCGFQSRQRGDGRTLVRDRLSAMLLRMWRW